MRTMIPRTTMVNLSPTSNALKRLVLGVRVTIDAVVTNVPRCHENRASG